MEKPKEADEPIAAEVTEAHYAALTRIKQFMDLHPSPKYGRSFQPRSQDVFISTYPKCGTTWVTQICHQLRSTGDMSFKEIAEVAPWDIMAQTLNEDLDADQKFTPRLFKSHETYGHIAKGGKYVVVMRNPFDAFISYYKFALKANAVPLAEFSMEQFYKVPQAWGFYSDWYAGWYSAWEKSEVNALWVFYEDLKINTVREVQRIAEFMGFASEEIEGRIKVAISNSTIEYMAEHANQFDEGLAMDAWEKTDIFNDNKGDATKVAKGKIGQGNRIPDKVVDMLNAEWQEHIEKALGFKSYEDFKKAVQN